MGIFSNNLKSLIGIDAPSSVVLNKMEFLCYKGVNVKYIHLHV